MATVSATSLIERCHGISAGVFAAPLGTLAEASRDIADWGGSLLHFDVMDGVFVPQITAGPAFVSALDAGLVRDVHLMVADPESQVDAFARAGADIITVHAEAPNARAALARIRSASDTLGRPVLAGLAIMPGTPIESVAALLDPMPDMILVLALDPRNSEPADVALAANRLRTLREIIAPARPIMAIDGGITETTIAEAAAAAPDVIVSGSAIFRASDPEGAFRRMNAACAAPASQAETL